MDTRFVSGLNDNARNTVVELLNSRLVDVIDLSLAVKQAHWMVKGSSFIGVHELLDQVVARVQESADLIAERAVIVGGNVDGTSQAVNEKSKMDAYPSDIVSINDHIKALTERFSAIGANIRQSIDDAADAGDEATADVLTEVVRQIDKDAWFIGAQIEK